MQGLEAARALIIERRFAYKVIKARHTVCIETRDKLLRIAIGVAI